MIASSKDDTDTKLDKFIVEFKKMLENVTSKLSEKELEAMKFHLYYYEETKRLMKIVAREASQLRPYIKSIKNNKIDVFSDSLIKKLEKHITQWETNGMLKR